MRRHKIPPVRVTHPNVTPLIDVVMCLIVFFMLVARLGVETGADERLQLPVSLQGITLDDLGNTVTLNVTPGAEQPQVTMLHPRTGQVEEVKISDGTKRPLKALLQVLKGENEKFKVIIRGDQELDYKFIEPVLMTCAEAQVRDVNFATRQPTETGK